jgi:hypothetical protein
LVNKDGIQGKEPNWEAFKKKTNVDALGSA